MTVHHTLGASTCDRWWHDHCPGSVALIGDTRGKATKAAAEGTVAHSICEVVVNRMLCQPEKKMESWATRDYIFGTNPLVEFKGKVINQDGFDIEVTQDMLDAVAVYVQYVQNLLNQAVGPIEARTETKVVIPVAGEELFGTADFILVDKGNKHIDVVDYKHGAGTYVEVEKNKQLMYYACGAWLLVDPDMVEDWSFSIHKVQPRMDNGVGSYAFGMDEMLEFLKDLGASAILTKQDGAPLRTGDWCKFCPAKGKCPAIKYQVQETAGMDFESPLPQLPAPVQNMTPDMVSRVLEHESAIKAWLSAVKLEAFNLLNQGVPVPGYKLVKKKANRVWVNEEQAKDILANAIGSSATVTKLISPAQAEKAIKELEDSLGFDLGVDMSTLSTTPDTGATVVKQSDKRKELPVGAQIDFIDVEFDVIEE